jgi:hypothetical protein
VNYFLDLDTHYFVGGDCENGLLTFEKQGFLALSPHTIGTFSPMNRRNLPW